MNNLFGVFYRKVIKKILFMFPADSVHELFLRVGSWLGKYKITKKIIRSMWRYDDTILSQKITEINFENPVGLSAGFDYNGDLVGILPSVGFGFGTVGTLTNEPYEGNPPPMLARLPKSKSLLVNKGFKNNGVEYVLQGIENIERKIPRGVSIGATNKPYNSYDEMVRDIMSGFRKAEKFKNFDFYELNISCPNLLNIQNLKEQISSPTGLKIALDQINSLGISRPVFVKMPLERSEEELEKIVDIMVPYGFVKGLIFSNLVKDRTNEAFDKKEIAQAKKGNFSGKPTERKSNQSISFAYRNYKNRFVLIGVGGVFSATDAYEKIKLGANLIQMITGMVYMGPQQIGLINKELSRLLRADGYKNIAEAVGSANT